MDRERQHSRRALAAVAVLLGAIVLAGCGNSKPADPLLTMPDLVGQPVGNAEAQTYDALHTSLIYYDLAPANRTAGNDWVVAATQPAAGKRTRKYQTVYAWVLRSSEYQWFRANPTMPRIPAGASIAKLTGTGGLLEPVKDLVQLRFAPGAAPTTAKASPVDAKAFTPDRGMHPDLATEPATELALRKGLLVATSKNTVLVGTRPGDGASLRPGQYLVVLVRTKPPKKKPTKTAVDFPTGSTSGSGSSGGGSSGSGGGVKLPGGIKIPNCPKALCG